MTYRVEQKSVVSYVAEKVFAALTAHFFVKLNSKACSKTGQSIWLVLHFHFVEKSPKNEPVRVFPKHFIFEPDSSFLHQFMRSWLLWNRNVQ